MCRNIKTLFNFEPPATADEIRASSVQFVRKLTGSSKPSNTNQAAFDRATNEIERIVQELFDSLSTTAPTRNREHEAEKARLRAIKRFSNHETR